MKKNRMTAKQMREMVGCAVNYRGREATVESVRPDMQMMRVVWDGGAAIIRPSELSS